MEIIYASQMLSYISNLSHIAKNNFITRLFGLILGDKPNCSCPHCGSTRYVKNGKNKDTQRFLCKNCNKSYTLNTNTVFYHSKKSAELWEKYALCLLECKPLHKCAQELNISVKTAFLWRHKFLSALKSSMCSDLLCDTIEMSHTYMLRSYKGNHSCENFTLPRAPKQRGPRWTQGNLFYNEPDKEKVCIFATIDNSNNLYVNTSFTRTMNSEEIIDLFQDSLKPGSTLITTNHCKYKYVAKKLNLQHVIVDQNSNHTYKYSLSHVKSLLKNMIMFFTPYKGISTKYLTNYISLFKYLHHEFYSLWQHKKTTIPLKLNKVYGC